MPDDNDKDKDIPAEDEIEDLPPEEGEADDVAGGARVVYPG